jgi:molecular chaperone DnaK (HSP70)
MAAIVGGELLVGWAAARAIHAGTADHAIRSVKRVIGQLSPEAPVPGLPGFTALELATRFLADLKEQLITHGNLDLERGATLEVMVAVPANSASRQRWMTLEAFRRAGFEPIGLLNEPTAAAVDFAHRHLELGKKSPKRYVVVYDLGGGTFDTSAVSLEGRRFDLIASEGLARLGGDDFDELILDVAGVAPTTAALEAARDAKETLRTTTRKLSLDLGGAAPISIDVATLYTRAQPLIDRTITQTDLLFERLRERGIDPEDPRELGGLYLVGGGAAFPAVGRALRARFGKKLQLAPQPFAATAVGLAIAADPDAHVIVKESITRHFGVWREADNGTDKVFDSLIGKNTDLPVVTRRYRPTHAVGHLRFLECGALDDAGQPIQDLVPCADVYFPYDPALDGRGEAELAAVPNDRRTVKGDEIAETYTYSTDGTISVRIENVSRGYGRTFTIGALR